ncbi:MAG: site-specific DNA-methyltransferase [Proteobacteria bacterium]|nr:site-specific DNA-methyltransferase [Pseudomonadota bacterium]
MFINKPNKSRHSKLVTPTYELYEYEAIEFLKFVPTESIDLVITDPPYESLEKHRAIGTTTRLKNSKASSNAWFKIFPNYLFPELLHEIYRILKKDSHFYLFCDQETAFIIKPEAESAGFKFWKPLIWDKKKIGMGYHYRARYEFILFFEKGKRKLSNLSIPDILEWPRIHRGYPTEKPPELSEILIQQSSSNNELICDPFMGSCSVGVAAMRHNRRFLGADISKEAFKISKKRLQSLES